MKSRDDHFLGSFVDPQYFPVHLCFAAQMLPLDKKPQAWVHHEDDLYFVKCKLAEEILEHLVDDTVKGCKTVFALKAKARQKWSKWLAGQMIRQRNDREA